MALRDPSFHDFTVNQWIDNFNDLTEPEYLLRTLDDLTLSADSAEVQALLKKDPDDLFFKIVDTLNNQEMNQLYKWTLRPEDFITDTGLKFDDERYSKFLSEFIPGYIQYRNQWDRNQFGKELRSFIQTLPQPYTNERKTRVKQCNSCGYNLSDLYASKLTADNILDDTPVSVVCPHCNMLNYFKF